jgi:hypothetical protein
MCKYRYLLIAHWLGIYTTSPEHGAQVLKEFGVS